MNNKELINIVVEFQEVRRKLITIIATKNKFLSINLSETIKSDTTDSIISKHSNRLPKGMLSKYTRLKDKILYRLTPTVYNLALYYSKRFKQVDIDDLNQEGYIAVIKAMVKFDSTQSNSFLGYAKVYVKSYQSDYINKNFSLIKIKYLLMREVIRDYRKNELNLGRWSNFAILQQQSIRRSDSSSFFDEESYKKNTLEDVAFKTQNTTIAKESMTLESLIEKIEGSMDKRSMEILKLKLDNPELFKMLNIDDREETKLMKKELKKLLMLFKEQGII